jgi:hypothetical protein
MKIKMNTINPKAVYKLKTIVHKPAKDIKWNYKNIKKKVEKEGKGAKN